MNIKLYRYLGERNKIDKSGDLVFVLETSGDFKGEVSILAPSLVLALPIAEGENITDGDGNRIADVILSEGESARVLNFNYFYVEEFRRGMDAVLGEGRCMVLRIRPVGAVKI